MFSVTDPDPNTWSWANETTNGEAANLEITSSGLYTLTTSMREDGLRLDRLLLTTDTTFILIGPKVQSQPHIALELCSSVGLGEKL